MSFFTGYYIGKQINKAIKEGQQRQRNIEYVEELKKMNEENERKKQKEIEEYANNYMKSAKKYYRKQGEAMFDNLRDELKSAINYDKEGFINTHINFSINDDLRKAKQGFALPFENGFNPNTNFTFDLNCASTLDEYKEGLYSYALELYEEDIKKEAEEEYSKLKQNIKNQVPKDKFLEAYVFEWDPWYPSDINTTGIKNRNYTSKETTLKIIDEIKKEISEDPYEFSEFNQENNEHNTSKSDELERWFSLYEKGAISLEEYQTVKNDILRNNNDNNKEMEEKKENLIYSICSTCGTKYESVLESPSKCFFCGGEISNNLNIAINNEIDFNRMNLSKDINEEDIEYILNQWEKIKHVISSDDFINKFNHIKEEYKDATFFDDKDFMDMIVNDFIRIINDD